MCKEAGINVIVILTGCIEPADVYGLMLCDSKERLKQYLKSIRFYLQCDSLNKIVFCDNSGYEYDYQKEYQLAEKNNKELEILTYREEYEKVKKRGKGYGEGQILKYVLDNSSLLKEEDYFYKVTGRMIIKNIDKIIENEKKEINYFNKNLYTYGVIDTRFYGIKKDIYTKYFLQVHDRVNDKMGRYLEHCFMHVLDSKKISYKCHAYFPVIKGISGTKGKEYMETYGAQKTLYDVLCKYNLYNHKLVHKWMFRLHHWIIKKNGW